MATFELWNMTSRNLVGTYPTEGAALESVRAAIARHGDRYADALALGCEDSRGRSTLIASGDALAQRAREVAPPPLEATVPQPNPRSGDRVGEARGPVAGRVAGGRRGRSGGRIAAEPRPTD